MNYLNNIGVPAIAIADIDEPELIQQVRNEIMLLSTIFPSACFQHRHGEDYLQTQNSKKNVLELLLMKLIAIPNGMFHRLLNKNNFWLYDFSFASLQLIAVYHDVCCMLFISNQSNLTTRI